MDAFTEKSWLVHSGLGWSFLRRVNIILRSPSLPMRWIMAQERPIILTRRSTPQERRPFRHLRREDFKILARSLETAEI